MPSSRTTSSRGGARRSGEQAGDLASTHTSTRASPFLTMTSTVDTDAFSTASTQGRATGGPPTTPEDPLDRASAARSLNASLDSLYGPTAAHINLAHMEQMAQYLQTAETQHSIDTLLSIIKEKDGGAGRGDYHTALDELDYLEGLFKKLRFSYKEQLTKETVVRRILELELPLLGAADIEQMVRDTEAQRQHLRALKAGGQAQGVAAERLIRDLTAERAYVVMAETAAAQLPDRMLRLRHRLARTKLALQAELTAMDAAGVARGTDSTIDSCVTCGRTFFSAAFQHLHQTMHGLDAAGAHPGAHTDALDFGDDAAAMPAASLIALQRCGGCTRMVPKVFAAAAAPAGESHAAFHARIGAAVADARATLVAATDAGTGTEVLLGDAVGSLVQQLQHLEELEAREAELEACETRVRTEAQRQAAVEGEAVQSLQHLRESVGSIRADMARLEHEAGRMVQYLQDGRTSLGRSLKEQADLLDMLLLPDEDDDGDDGGEAMSK